MATYCMILFTCHSEKDRIMGTGNRSLTVRVWRKDDHRIQPRASGGVMEQFCVLTVALVTCPWAFLLKLCRMLCPKTYILQHVNNIPVKKRIKKVTYASIYDILEEANTLGT